MRTVFLIVLMFTVLITIDGVKRIIDQFENFGPVKMSFCDRVSVSSHKYRNAGGTICGDRSRMTIIKKVSKNISILSKSRIGLMSVKWSLENLKTQKVSPVLKNYFKHCHPFMVQLFDAVYKNKQTSCAYTMPSLSYKRQCNVKKDVMLRFGSGYCMKQRVCGAKVPIFFMVPPNSTALLYVWETNVYESLMLRNYTVVDMCFGFANIPNA